ncbi:MAG TPA: hypothetical protein VE263_13655 [Candidatus Angelobacter sp.]|nr:hypothetical protein [Candidatus Angelobacter sp.]
MPTLVEVADSSLMAKALNAHSPDLIDLAKQAEGDPQLLLGAMDALGSVSLKTRTAASNLLLTVSERSPEALYPHFGVFVRFLHNKRSVLKLNAMLTLANLAVVDHERKLEAILDEYLAPICGPSLIEATCALRGAAVIATARPDLAERISKSVVAVEKAEFASRDSHHAAIGKAVAALAHFFPFLRDGHAARLFVRRQLKNPSRATRNKARRFLQKWPARHGQFATH